MKSNLTTPNRIARIVIASVIAILFITNTVTGTLAIVLLVIAGMMLLTSVINFCPMAISGFCPKDLVKKVIGKKE